MSITKTVQSTKLLDATTLESTATATEAAADRTQLNTANADQLMLSCTYTTGTAETNNTATIEVEAYDGFAWNQIGVTTHSTGTATTQVVDFDIVGAAAATEYHAFFQVNNSAAGTADGRICYKKIRVAAYETGVDTNKGTLSVVALIQ